MAFGGITQFSRLSAILTLDITGFLRNSELANNALRKLGQNATVFGQRLSRGFGVAFALVGGAAVSVAAQFDAVNRRLKALNQGGGFKELTEQSRRLGETTKFTQLEIAKAQVELAKMGTAGPEILKLVEPVAALAGVLDEDLVDSAKGIRQAINIFGGDMNDAADVMDLFAVAVQNSALTMSSLREGLKNVGSQVKAQGGDIKDAIALLMLLADAAIEGGAGGTKLKAAFAAAAKEGLNEARDTIALLTSQMLDFNSVLDLVNNRGLVPALLIGQNADDLERFNGLLENATGTSEKFAAAFDESLYLAFEQVRNAVIQLGIELGTSLQPTLESVRDLTVNLAAAYRDANDSTKIFIASFVTLIPLLGAAGFLIGQMSIAVAALTTPIGVLALAIGALVIDMVAFNSELAAIEAKGDNAANGVDSVVKSMTAMREGNNVPGLKKEIQNANEELANINATILEFEAERERIQNEGRSIGGLFIGGRFNPDFNLLKAVTAGLPGGGETLRELEISFNIVDRQLRKAREKREELLKEKETAQDIVNLNQQQLDHMAQAKKVMEQRRAIAAFLKLKAEEEATAQEKVKKILRQVRGLFGQVQAKGLNDQQEAVARLNARFDALKAKLQDLGASTTALEQVRTETVKLLKEFQAADRADFLLKLTEDNQISQGGLPAVLQQIEQDLRLAKKSADEAGLLTPEAEVQLERKAAQEKIRANAEFFEKKIDLNRELLRQSEEFNLTDTENEIAELERRKALVLAQFSGTEEERLKIAKSFDDKITKTRKEGLEEQQRDALSNLQLFQQFTDAIGSSFTQVINGGVNFFEALNQAFTNFFANVIGRLVSLIVLFGILSAIAGGGTGIGKLAAQAIGPSGPGQLGSFLSTGFGFTRSATGGGVGGGFRLDGRDLVLSTNRTERANTRIL